MKGRYLIRVKNSRNKYEFELKRNITVLQGLSGRGKTTLFEMIREYNRFGKDSGVSVYCERGVYALEGDNWKSDIQAHSGEIIVIDEDSQFIRSQEFAESVKGSDNYYLLITRNYLPNLPISVDEIYKLEGGKTKRIKNVYNQVRQIYDLPVARYLPFEPEVIITEDSGSGFQFFKHEADRLGIQCFAAGGKTKIFNLALQFQDKNVVVIADGASFGAEIEKLVKLQQLHPQKLAIFLPESFEWLLLTSVDKVTVMVDWLEFPENYADSMEFMSWEQFFTKLLIDVTKDISYMRYRKNRLADYYLQEKTVEAIKKNIPGLKI